MRHHSVTRVVSYLSGLLVTIAACGDGLTGPAAEDCGPPPYFTMLPVAPSDFDAIAVYGGLGAPGHTLPTAHTGFHLSREGASVTTPGPMQVTEIRRVRYLASPNRQGVTDYALYFQICQEVSGWFGHLTSLAPGIPAAELEWRDCESYSTAEETVENCTARPPDFHLSTGDPMGTGGHSIALGLMGLDFGMLDSRVNHFYVNRSLHPKPTLQAICPWEQFDAANQAILFSRLKDLGMPWIVPAGEPRCGAMQVDEANTAKGVWREVGQGPAQGDERRFVTLANYPYRPEDHLALSLGPVALGARVGVVPRQAAGRVNRGFEHVTVDGNVYCYTAADPTAESWFLTLTGPAELRVRRVSHAAGASPCAGAPEGWSVEAGLTLIR